MANKIPKWWYAGFKRGFFYGCRAFIRAWLCSASNPFWIIKEKLKKVMYK